MNSNLAVNSNPAALAMPVSAPFPPITLQSSPLPSLSKADYPNIKYWDKREWTSVKDITKGETTMAGPGLRGTARASKGINVTMLYIGDEEGIPVDGHRATAIRNVANQIFFQLLKQGIAPVKWGQAGAGIRQWYNTEMDHQFPEMRLCAGNWKAENLATAIYPSWYTSHCRLPKLAEVKVEETQDQSPVLEVTRGRKRKGSATAGKKRAKLGRQVDTEPKTETGLTVCIYHFSDSLVLKLISLTRLKKPMI